jgi:hypothetical protein
MMTLSIDGPWIPQTTKRRTVITLSQSKQPAGLQLFAAIGSRTIFISGADGRILVLDLFSRRVMLWP